MILIRGGIKKLSNITDSKPEPISARPNWHYDTYFLLQLDRLNIRKQNSQYSKQQKPEQMPYEIEANAAQEMTDSMQVQECQLQNINCSNVVHRINELARSIGISVTIIEKR